MRESFTVQPHHYLNVLQVHARVWSRGREWRGACPADVGVTTYQRLMFGDLGLAWAAGAMFHAANALRQMTGRPHYTQEA